jgi:hypothetical protein
MCVKHFLSVLTMRKFEDVSNKLSKKNIYLIIKFFITIKQNNKKSTTR